MNPVAILGLLSDLYSHGQQQDQLIASLEQENAELRARLEEAQTA